MRWSDPRTWGGRVPDKDDLVVVSRRIILDVNARVRGVRITRKGALIFHPGRSVTLRTTGNVVVYGRLRFRPARPSIVHRLVFPEIDERRFIGGGMDVMPSDVGLWVAGAGVLDIAGSAKRAWTRAIGGVPAGATSITLQDEPTGWRTGDEVVITPTLSPANSNHDVAYDIGIVTAVDRLTRRITLRSPTTFEHPDVEIEPGVRLGTEILNLSRNVRIEGRPNGRCHVWIRSSRPQLIHHAALRYTGPRQPIADAPPFTSLVAGRYGLHFHVMKGASRGSRVEGVVVRDSGNRAFVTHESHGVKFRDCISHNTLGDAYWWDPSPKPDVIPAPPTHDVLYERCVASMVSSGAPFEALRAAGFFLGARSGNTIRECVAVGVQGHSDSSGFHWPEASTGLWTFEDCVAHNNRENGITAWQITELPSTIKGFIGYHNGRFGIMHGYYFNGFGYENCVLFGNKLASIVSLAVSTASPVQEFAGIRCDQAGLSPHCVVSLQRIAPPKSPVHFLGCRFRGYTKAAFGFVDENSPFPNSFNIVDCGFEGNEFWLGSTIHPASQIHVKDAIRGSITLRRADQPGALRSEWNASVS